MLAHRLRRWPNIEPTLAERPVFAGKAARQYDTGTWSACHSGIPTCLRRDTEERGSAPKENRGTFSWKVISKTCSLLIRSKKGLLLILLGKTNTAIHGGGGGR